MFRRKVPAPIWKEFMEKVVEDLPIEEWPEILLKSIDIMKFQK